MHIDAASRLPPSRNEWHSLDEAGLPARRQIPVKRSSSMRRAGHSSCVRALLEP